MTENKETKCCEECRCEKECCKPEGCHIPSCIHCHEIPATGEEWAKLVEKFVEEVADYGFNDEYGYYNDWKDDVKPIIEKHLKLLLSYQQAKYAKRVEDKIEELQNQFGRAKIWDCSEIINILENIKKLK